MEFNLGPENIKIITEWGIPLAITGMLIVFFSLTLISVYIATLPKVLALLENYLPESKAHDKPATDHKVLSKQVIAAISFALHHQNNNKG